MKLALYSEARFGKLIQNYQLPSTPFVGSPAEMLENFGEDPERFMICLTDESENLLGFFCLHLGHGPEQYHFFGAQYGLIRGFSIDQRFRGQGYASQAFDGIFEFIQEKIDSKITHLILAVNEKNQAAQKAYSRAGFTALPDKIDGRIGKLIIMEKTTEMPKERDKNEN